MPLLQLRARCDAFTEPPSTSKNHKVTCRAYTNERKSLTGILSMKTESEYICVKGREYCCSADLVAVHTRVFCRDPSLLLEAKNSTDSTVSNVCRGRFKSEFRLIISLLSHGLRAVLFILDLYFDHQTNATSSRKQSSPLNDIVLKASVSGSIN